VPGDPLRWSNVVAEIVLMDMIPRKVAADPTYLRGMPDALRTVIRYAHDRRDIPERYTRQALAAVDEFEPDYLDAVSHPCRQGPEALLERMGALPPLGEFDQDVSDEEYFLGSLAANVGGMAALDALDEVPLADEELDLDSMPDDIRDRVRRVEALAADVCENYFGDVELRTVARRILARVAPSEPIIFRRNGRDETAAAALCWIVAKANDVFACGTDPNVAGMMAYLGLKGTPGQRAQPMLRALGVEE